MRETSKKPKRWTIGSKLLSRGSPAVRMGAIGNNSGYFGKWRSITLRVNCRFCVGSTCRAQFTIPSVPDHGESMGNNCRESGLRSQCISDIGLGSDSGGLLRCSGRRRDRTCGEIVEIDSAKRRLESTLVAVVALIQAGIV